MTDLTHLDDLAADPLTEPQLRGILAQIDLDVVNLLRDGKLAALSYKLPGPAGPSADRAANLEALLAARRHYQTLLDQLPTWLTSTAAP